MDRIKRVNEQIKREISEIVQRELGDSRLRFVTITGVEVSRDLQTAKVYFSVLGEAAAVEAAHHALKSAAGMIRRLVGARVKIRYTPMLSFFYDRSIEFSARIENALTQIHHDKDKEDHPDDQG
ncbi:MAG: 30S ribosome-binding factor RbfA [Candidatus Omnitrophica bacterium]|nr:30S ribosome-binding factor RbfA [Candidatus Omnitrophota bacterium]